MQILQSLHAAIVVSDLEQAAWFYGTVLNLPLVDRPLNFPGIWYQVGSFQLHVIAAETVIPDQINFEKWGRNRHLAFAIANLAEAEGTLRDNHCPIQKSASGRAALFTQDPDGNLIELSEI